MQEFESISASSYDPSALATKLTAKAADGWSVVAIVPTGGDVTAFLSRDKSGADTRTPDSVAAAPEETRDDDIAPFVLPANNSSSAETTTAEPRETAPEPVSEPAGWAIAPEAAAGATAVATTPTLAGSGSSAMGQSAQESAPAGRGPPGRAHRPGSRRWCYCGSDDADTRRQRLVGHGTICARECTGGSGRSGSSR